MIGLYLMMINNMAGWQNSACSGLQRRLCWFESNPSLQFLQMNVRFQYKANIRLYFMTDTS